jgi:hypothetical protein
MTDALCNYCLQFCHIVTPHASCLCRLHCINPLLINRLKELLRAQQHHLITDEIRRELFGASARKDKLQQQQQQAAAAHDDDMMEA